MSTSIISLIILIVFLGALTRATFGFGEAVVSMPLLALLPIDLHLSISLIALVGLIVALLAAFKDWQQVDRVELKRLVIGAIFGIPVGILFVLFVPASIIMIALGIFLIIYGSYSLIIRLVIKKEITVKFQTRYLSIPVGFISGILGSAYNSHGVPIVVFGTLKEWTPSVFRGTMQSYFLIVGLFIIASHAIGGLWSIDTFILFGLSLPFILLAARLGRWIYEHIPSEKFIHLIFILLVILGVLLLIK